MANFEKNPKKPSQLSCLFCINSDTNVKKFKMTEEYGGGNTIRIDLTSFLGYQIESYLKDEDVLCSNCMNFFENMAYTKRRLIDFLKDRDKSADVKIKGFNDIWRGFAKFAVNLVKVNSDDLQESWETESYNHSSRPQTPNPLVFKYAEVYDHEYERQLMERESIRSNSVAPSLMSETDSEIRRLFRRKKRGHNWVRRKGERKSLALSKSYDSERSLSSRSRRSTSVRSSMSTSSTTRRRKRVEVENRTLKTRSVSRVELSDAERTAEIESQKFYCDDLSCPLFFENLDNLNTHKVEDHEIYPRYNCNVCSNAYTTRHDLDFHSKIHDEKRLCFQCGAELQNTQEFQDHIFEHQIYSVDCLYCFMSFLTKSDLSRHVSREHKGRDRNRVHEKMCRIFKSVRNEEKMRAERLANVKRRKQYQAIVLTNEEVPQLESEEVPQLQFAEVPQLQSAEVPQLQFEEVPQLQSEEVPHLQFEEVQSSTPAPSEPIAIITTEELDISDVETPDLEENSMIIDENSMVIDDSFENVANEENEENVQAEEPQEISPSQPEHDITFEEVTEEQADVIEEPSADMIESMDTTVNTFDAQKINEIILGTAESSTNNEEIDDDNWQLTKMHPLVVLERLDEA